MFFRLLGLILLGVTLAIYRGSPYFGALGLVLISVGVCGVSGFFGFSFLGLVLVLTYLGGMIVVFIYSRALASDKYPSVGRWKGRVSVLVLILYYFFLDYFVLSGSNYTPKGSNFLYNSHCIYSKGRDWVVSSFLESLDWGNCGLLYSCFRVLLFLVALVLLVSLVLVLVISFGSYKRRLRALK